MCAENCVPNMKYMKIKSFISLNSFKALIVAIFAETFSIKLLHVFVVTKRYGLTSIYKSI